ncbi:MAG: efflux transporter outer membrane subunit [Lentisphaerae bacterium]|jgi:multidrug efflux system outer membrane protein|nr:efflux transporter outer membrane subunit [Lentisphaerota bacterium]
MRIVFIALLTLGCLCGCTMIPKYERPAAPVPQLLPGEAEPAAQDAAPDISQLPWREVITDANLQRLIDIALENNRDFRLAAQRVELTRALYNIQRQELFPSLYAVGGGGRQRSAADLTPPGQPRTSKHYSANLSVLSWELDFFGYLRSLSEQAIQEYLATEQARRSAQIMLVATVAQGYWSLAAEREALQLAESTLKSQQEAYALVKHQYETGLVNELDFRRAQTPLEIARVDVARYQRQAEQAGNALRLLLGQEPPAQLLPAQLSGLAAPATLRPGLSSEQLLLRPDVIAAEHQLLAAQATIGVARAAFFPRITLTGALGTASDELSRLFKSGNGTWSFTPQITMPIFDARTWSAHRASKVQREMALTQYERAIQNAFRETADALSLCRTIGNQRQAQEALVSALAETYRLAQLRFEKGVDSYLGVLDAQRSLFAAQQALISLRLAEHSSQLQLYAALGGGGAAADQPAE